MEAKDLTALVLIVILTGLLLAVGMVVLDKFQRAARTTGTRVDTAINLSGVTGSATLTKTYCLAVSSVDNATNSFSLTTYNVTLANADTCAITATNIPCSVPKCNVTYTYGITNDAATSLLDVNTAIAPIASTWLALVITVAVLAVILGIVMTSFMVGNRK